MQPLLNNKMDDWNYHYDWLISIPTILDKYINEYKEKIKTKQISFEKEKFILEYLINCKKEIEKILKNDIVFNEHRDILPKKIR
jgi:hypothetical protein